MKWRVIMKKVMMLIGAAACIINSSAIFACRVDIVNDNPQKDTVIVGDKEVEEYKIINHGKKDFVGSETRRPTITLYMKESKTGPFKKKYKIKMVACAAHADLKQAELKVSDIIGDTYDKELFEATPYVSNMHKTLMKTPEVSE